MLSCIESRAMRFVPKLVLAVTSGQESRSCLETDGARTLHDHHPYGRLTFEEVLIKSSNIGMAKIGKKMGNERLHKYVKAFGFGDKTGIDISGEDPGIVQPYGRWTSFTTTSIPMGQEIAVTPLQMARAFCVFANRLQPGPVSANGLAIQLSPEALEQPGNRTS